MPIYRSAGIAVELDTINLDTSISQTNNLGREDGLEDVRRVTAAVEGPSDRLRELPVLDEQNQSPIRFLGSDKDAPFFLAQVFSPSAKVQSNPRSTTTRSSTLEPSSNPPRALVLKVDLTRLTAIPPKGQNKHVKVEVFYNGELSACRLLSLARTDTWNATQTIQVFAGRRITRQHERPWVLHSGKSTAAFGDNESILRLGKAWSQVRAALLCEVVERGKNRYGEAPPTADYLNSLCALPLPQLGGDTHDICKGLPGIIDVVVTFGHGSKEGPGVSNNMAPTRLRDDRYQVSAAAVPRQPSPTKRVRLLPPKPPSAQSTTEGAAADQNSENKAAGTTKQDIPPTAASSPLSEPELILSDPLSKLDLGPSGAAPTEVNASAGAEQSVPPAAEAESTVPVANDGEGTPAAVTDVASAAPRFRRWSTEASSLARSGMIIPPKLPWGTGKESTQVNKPIDEKHFSNPAPKPRTSLPEHLDDEIVLNTAAPVETPSATTKKKPPASAKRRRTGTPVPSAKKSRPAAKPRHIAPTPPSWGPSPFAASSVFTYARPDMVAHLSTAPEAGVIRQVRKERPGTFEEKSILLGVRYVML